jgi:hypothetical protein
MTIQFGSATKAGDKDKIFFSGSQIAFHANCCEECCWPCGGLSASELPSQFEIVISGVVDGPCADGLCDDINGTFTVGFDSIVSGICTWVYESTLDGCGYTDVVLLFSITATSSNMILHVLWEEAGGGGDLLCYFRESFSLPKACDAIDDSVDYYDSIATEQCDASSATCTVTAL